MLGPKPDAPERKTWEALIERRAPSDTIQPMRTAYGVRAFVFLALACVIAVLAWQARAGAPGHGLRDWLDVWATYDLEAVPVKPEPYIVQPGDTIWRIAERYRLPGDIRMTVDIIRELNSLWGPDGPRLRPGQRLKVPEPDRDQWPLAMQHAWQ